MLKNELLSHLSAQSGESKTTCANVLAALQEVVEQQTVGAGNKITIPGLCSFTQKVKPKREVRNPKTGERMYAEEKICLQIKPAEKLK